MSLYWAAYHGQGLALSKSEFSVFLENYKTQNKQNKELLSKIKAVEDGEEDIYEINFVTSAGKTFSLFCADDGCAEGFRLTPYRVNGKPNTDWDTNEDLPSNNVYVLDADRLIDGMECFDKKAYESYEEFVNEFKDKLEPFLPLDFDWDAHIGIYSYVCYA